jgi:SH3-like domain-containing protein
MRGRGVPLLTGCLILLCLALPQKAKAERLAVCVPEAQVRAGPGTNTKVLWRVEKYYPVNVIEHSGKWCRFRDFEGDEGWLHESVLDGSNTVITRGDNCKVRSGPGENSAAVFTANRGVPLKVLKKSGHWVNVQHMDGTKGWIAESLIW